MRSDGRALLCRGAVVALSSLCCAPVLAETVERVLAVVDGRPVFLSEVLIEEGLKGLDRRAALEAAIDERLMAREAGRVPQSASTVEEQERAFRSLLENAPDALRSTDEAGLRRIARRQLAIVKYIAFRFRPQVRVEDEEVRRAYETEYGGSPDAPPFDDVSGALTAAAESRRLDALVEEWIKELRDQASIRRNPLGN